MSADRKDRDAEKPEAEGPAAGAGGEKAGDKDAGNACGPGSLPLLNPEKAEDYDDLSEAEKELAAAISQDWDA